MRVFGALVLALVCVACTPRYDEMVRIYDERALLQVTRHSTEIIELQRICRERPDVDCDASMRRLDMRQKDEILALQAERLGALQRASDLDAAAWARVGDAAQRYNTQREQEQLRRDVDFERSRQDYQQRGGVYVPPRR